MNLDPLPIINAVVKDSTAFMGWRVEPIGETLTEPPAEPAPENDPLHAQPISD